MSLPIIPILASMLAINAPPPSSVTYVKQIKPMLQSRCVVCHNQSTLSTPAISGGLALDSYAAVRTGTTGTRAHAILVAGKSADSELFKRLTATSLSRLMPKGGPALPASGTALFKRWIDAGAPSGQVGEEKATTPGQAAIPMPKLLATQAIRIPTRLAAHTAPTVKGAPDPTLAVVAKLGPLPMVTALAFSPDSKLLAVGAYRAVTLWSAETGQPIGTVSELPGQVQCVQFSPDGAELAIAGGAAGSSGDVLVVNVKTLAQVGPRLSAHQDVVYSVAWSPDGKLLATASQDKTARIWEWPSGKPLQVLKDHSEAVTRVAFAPDGKSLYTASNDHNVRRFDVANGQALKVFTGHADVVSALAVSPDGKWVVSSGPEPRLRWWNPTTGATDRTSMDTAGPVTELTFSRDGKLLASVGADQRVRIWDGASGAQQRELTGDPDWIYAVTFSPDGRFVAAAGAQGVVRLWQPADGRLRLSLLSWPPANSGGPVDWLSITPEGYLNGSAAWLRAASLAGPSAPLKAGVDELRRPDEVLKAWRAAPLDPAPVFGR